MLLLLRKKLGLKFSTFDKITLEIFFIHFSMIMGLERPI